MRRDKARKCSFKMPLFLFENILHILFLLMQDVLDPSLLLTQNLVETLPFLPSGSFFFLRIIFVFFVDGAVFNR